MNLTKWNFIAIFSRFAPYIATTVMEPVQWFIQNSKIVSILILLFNGITDVSILLIRDSVCVLQISIKWLSKRCQRFGK